MKHLITITFIFSCSLAIAQAPLTRFVGNCQFSSFSLLADSTYRGNITNFDDRLADGVNASGILAGFEIIDGRGLVFTVDTVHSSTFVSADVTVTAVINRGFSPAGSGQVYSPTSKNLIPPSSVEQLGLSPVQKAKIDRHNIVLIDSLLAVGAIRDTVFSITSVSDTSALVPLQGDAFINSTADTLGVYNGRWVLFFGGGGGGGSWAYDYGLPTTTPSTALGDTTIIAYIGDGAGGYDSLFLSTAAFFGNTWLKPQMTGTGLVDIYSTNGFLSFRDTISGHRLSVNPEFFQMEETGFSNSTLQIQGGYDWGISSDLGYYLEIVAPEWQIDISTGLLTRFEYLLTDSEFSIQDNDASLNLFQVQSGSPTRLFSYTDASNEAGLQISSQITFQGVTSGTSFNYSIPNTSPSFPSGIPGTMLWENNSEARWDSLNFKFAPDISSGGSALVDFYIGDNILMRGKGGLVTSVGTSGNPQTFGYRWIDFEIDTINYIATKADLAGVGGGTDDQTAAEVPITDSGGNYTATDVEGALAEVADSVGQLRTDIDAIGAGASDGVATAGTLDAGNEEIDMTVAAPGSNFSIDLSGIENLASFAGWDTDDSDDITGSGTANDIPIFTSTNTLGDSWISQDATNDAMRIDAGKTVVTGTAIEDVANYAAACPLVATKSYWNATTGAIEIRLPTSDQFTSAAGRTTLIAFKVAVTSDLDVKEFHVKLRIEDDLDIVASGSECFLVGDGIFKNNFRVGAEGGRHKVWIGDTTQDWSNAHRYNITVSDVRVGHSGLTNAAIANQACTGWEIQIRTTGWTGLTLDVDQPINNQKSRLFKYIDTFNDITDEVDPTIFGVSLFSGTGAIELKMPLPNATLEAREFNFSTEVWLNLIGGGAKLKRFRLNATLDYNNPATPFSDGVAEWEGAAPPDIPVRLGWDDSRPVIWIGDATTVWNNLYVGVSDMRTTHASGPGIHNELLTDFTWAAEIESNQDSIDTGLLIHTAPQAGEFLSVGPADYGVYSGVSTTGAIMPAGSDAQRGSANENRIIYNTDEDLWGVTENGVWRFLPSTDDAITQLDAGNYSFDIDQTMTAAGGLSMVYNEDDQIFRAEERAHAQVYNGTMDSIQTTGSGDFDLLAGWLGFGEKSDHWTITDTSIIYAGPTIVVNVHLQVGVRASTAANWEFQIGYATSTGLNQFIIPNGTAHLQYLRASPIIEAVNRTVQFEVQDGYEIKTRGGGINGGVGIVDGGITIKQVN